MNQAILVGQLGNDATRRVTKSGLAVIQFPLVTKRRSTNSAGDTIESSTWHHIVYWGSRKPDSLKRIFAYLIQGKTVGVQGEIHLNEWDHNGERRYRTEIHTRAVTLLSGTEPKPSDLE
ncbi:MAG: single-stranded DNA-binding protein [Acidobacteria bacterium]|nr:single-stranded DNA-binding protein [Acidobacteriota bacterium]